VDLVKGLGLCALLKWYSHIFMQYRAAVRWIEVKDWVSAGKRLSYGRELWVTMEYIFFLDVHAQSPIEVVVIYIMQYVEYHYNCCSNSTAKSIK
jgi:tRNA splicing ligase